MHPFRHASNDDHPIPEFVESIGADVVDAAVHVHQELGPGLLEEVYRICMMRSLTKRGRRVVSKAKLPIRFDGEVLPTALEPDLIVDDHVIVELKAVEAIHPVHKAQIMTYLRLSERQLGFLLNFNVSKMHLGVKRFICA